MAGAGDLSAALAYGNHSSSARFSPHILDKIVEDVSHGRSFVFPRDVVDQIPGIRFSMFTISSSEALTSTNSRGRSQGRLIWCVGGVACRRQQQQIARSRAFDVLVDMN